MDPQWRYKRYLYPSRSTGNRYGRDIYPQNHNKNTLSLPYWYTKNTYLQIQLHGFLARLNFLRVVLDPVNPSEELFVDDTWNFGFSTRLDLFPQNSAIIPDEILVGINISGPSCIRDSLSKGLEARKGCLLNRLIDVGHFQPVF